MSETPRTDEEETMFCGDIAPVWELCRKLEMELSSAKDRLVLAQAKIDQLNAEKSSEIAKDAYRVANAMLKAREVTL